jgi:hypothetical protein
MIDEILVHISTPATRQNDDLYRSLADSYLNFEPHKQHVDVADKSLAGSDIPSASLSKSSIEPARSSLLSTSRESYGSFPSHISSVYHADRPKNVEIQSAEVESIPPSSRLARLDRIHRLWKEKTTPRSNFVNRERLSSRTSRTSQAAGTGFVEDTQLGAEALQSQLPDSYSTTDEDTSEDEAEPEILPRLISPAIASDGRMNTANSTIEVAGAVRPTSKPALSSISANERTKLQLSNISKSSSSSNLHPSKKRKLSEPPSETFDFSELPRDAFPPAPIISTERPARLPSQVSKHLAALKTQNPKRFKLTKRHGSTPRHDDRGHWSVDTSTWPASIQKEFWESLYDCVCKGRLGWGVTLYRDAAASSALGHVRLYCWAEIVEHTWLMMWICSKGEIVKSGSNWMNADGNVMFEVAEK